MASSQHSRFSDPTPIDALPRVVEPICVGNKSKQSVAEKASEFHRVLSTPPQRKEEGKKRGLEGLNEKSEVSKQPLKKKRCRVKVADDKFSLKPKKAKVKIPKPAKVRKASCKKDPLSKRKYVHKKKEQPYVAVRTPEAANDAVVGEVVVSEEALLDSAKGDEFKGACRRALEFTDQVFEVPSKPPSPLDGELSDKAVESPLLLKGKLNNSKAAEGYISSDRCLNLAEEQDSQRPSIEAEDYEELSTNSTAVPMSEPDIEMELKALESLRLDSDSLNKDASELIVYVRKKKAQPSINIQHNVAYLTPPSAKEVKVNKNESRVGTFSIRTMLDSAGKERFTGSSRQGLNLDATSICQTNSNKANALSSLNSKNEDPLRILHDPLVSNGRNARACQCIQMMRKCKLNVLKIYKQPRMIRKKRVDVSGLFSPFQTREQETSNETICLNQEVSIPTKKQRSKGVARRRDFSSLLTVPQFNKLAATTSTAEQQCSVQEPKTNIWPTCENLVTVSKCASPLQEERVCARSQEVGFNKGSHSIESLPLFTINEHLFASNMTYDSGYASQNSDTMPSISAPETGLDYSDMNIISCSPSYGDMPSLVPWTNELVPVHSSAFLGAEFHTTGQSPLLNFIYNNNQLLNPGRFSVATEQESIFEARSGLWTINDPNYQNLLYNSQLQVPHLELGSTADVNRNSVSSDILVSHCEPSTIVHGQELVARVDNSLDVLNDISNQALVTSIKKKKVIPHVNFDSKTMPMWKALMGKGDYHDHQCNEDEESKKWWQKERRVFEDKVQAIMSCMHRIQGNRRFSLWKGSVLDSVMGVFLTQNVSDHLSSFAYMSLAAKYPVGPAQTQKAAQEEHEVTGASQDSCESNEAVFKSSTELTDQESLNDMLLVREQAAPLQDSLRTDCRDKFTENNQVKDDFTIPTVGLSGFEEWLFLKGQTTQAQDSFHPKSETKECHSQQEPATLHQNPSDPNSEIEKLLSQEEQTHNSSHSEFGSMKYISHQQEPMTQPQNASDLKSKVEELFSHKQNQTAHSEDSALPKSEADELLSHKKEQKQHQDSTNPNVQKNKTPEIDWIQIKRKYCNEKSERNKDHSDSVDWDAVRRAPVEEVAETIKKRGQHNILAASMQKALNRIYSELGSLDLEWLRDTPPDVTKDFLLSIDGLGLKSVECIRLLALEQVAFPVDTNVGRIAVRLGWVDLKDVPEGLQFHLLEQYPMMDAIQKYLWPRLCELDQLTLYELHYQLITFGKVFCKKRGPYCNACPLRASCKYFASAYVSARLPITGSADAGSSQSPPLIGNSGTQSQSTNHEPIVEMPASPEPYTTMLTLLEPDIEMPTSPQPYTYMYTSPQPYTETLTSPQPYTEMPTSPQPYIEIPTSPQPSIKVPNSQGEHHLEVLEPRHSLEKVTESMNQIVEMPRTPESEHGITIGDIEDLYTDCPEIPTIVVSDEEFIANLSKYLEENKFQTGAEISNALVVSTHSAKIPARKLKNIKDLRTEHLVYEIPDSHPLLRIHGLEERDLNDQCLYLLSIWSPAEKPNEEKNSDDSGCQQQDVDCVLGTFMIPCRTAMRGRFPLNGTYFQVNEVFADDETSHCPVKIPRSLLWNLNKNIVYCGSSTSSITTGLTTEEIQLCFWRDYICIRGFNRITREPKELLERFHKLRTATQTKRPSATNQPKPKKKKNGEQKWILALNE